MPDPIGEAHARSVRPALELVDKLRGFGIEKDLSIPQIAVMGDQSSGKSSVLEFISGIPFPRGTGLVTRCATQLSMKRGATWEGRAWLSGAQGAEQHAITLTDPTVVGGAILDLTEKALGHNAAAGLSDDTIVINITAPDAPDLTLIDLPGIVRTNVKGQTKEMIGMVDALIDKYLTQERTIVLAVIPATVDVATVDILERAHAADPDGERTIGVLTKLDLVPEDAHDSVLSVLQNLTKPLKLGYVAVKNRSQKDLDRMTLTEARDAEKAFFKTHTSFSTAPSNLVGVDTLTSRLTEILVGRIKAHMPEIQTQVNKQLADTNAELQRFGATPPASQREQHMVLMKLLQDLDVRFGRAVDAEYTTSDDKSLRLYARARLQWDGFKKDVHETWPTSLLEYEPLRKPHSLLAVVDDVEDMQQQLKVEVQQLKVEVAAELEAMRVRRLGEIFNSRTFCFFAERFVDSWEPLAMDCLRLTMETTTEVLNLCLDGTLSQFPSLRSKLKSVSASIVQRCFEETGLQVQKQLEFEREPFTLNHYLFDTINKMRLQNFEKKLDEVFSSHTGPDNKISTDGVKQEMVSWFRSERAVGGSNSAQEVEEMIAVLNAYWKTASKRFIDNVCNTVDSGVLRGVQKQLLTQCAAAASAEDPAMLASLFEEDTQSQSRRTALELKWERLQNARLALDRYH